MELRFSSSTWDVHLSSVAVIAIMIIIGVSVPQSALPVGYEMSAELSYPVNECTANAVIVFWTNFVSYNYNHI